MAARMVITGAGGQVGRVLAVQAAHRGYDVAALRHTDLDITDSAAVIENVAGVDLVVNCAAVANVDVAESQPEAAHAINAEGPRIIAAACADVGARMIHISTDYVFRGDPGRPYEVDDPTGPLGVYGRTKLAGEEAVAETLPAAHIVRTSWVYTGGIGDSDFVAVMRRLAAGDTTAHVVDDQTGSPTFVDDLVSALFEVAERDIRPGILHVANAGAVSRFEQARAVFAEVGADPDRVRPIPTSASGRAAPRPVFSELSMEQSVRAGLSPLRSWREALAEALR